jgi:hypothetical protein
MKRRKLRHCLAGLLLLAMLVNIAVSPPAQAQAQSPAILKWTEVDTPGAKGEVIVTPSEVSRIAAGRGDILYAIDSENSKVYRSDNGGLTWTNITRGLLTAGAVLPASEIAVAPDKPQNVTVVTDSRTKVYLSTDSGASWSNTNVPGLSGATIQCITISRAYSIAAGLAYDIAIGTKDGTGNGNVYVLKIPGFGGWVGQSFSGDVMALQFSPTYNGDNTIVIVYCDGTGTYLNAGNRDLAANTTDWTAIYTSPIEISDPPGNSPAVIETADLELPSEFSGQTSSLRRIYVSTDASNGNTGVFRIDDTTVYQLMDTTGLFATKRISSIAYFGTYDDGKLLAGEVNPVPPPPPVQAVQVWRSPDPRDVTPSWYSASQPPSGPGNAQVAWSYGGRMAFCGTSRAPSYVPPFPEPPPFPDESAFSRSVDDGDTWEQTSLIDTVINISDIAPAPDSKSLFLATYSLFGVEGVWRSAGEPLGNFWGRVLTMNTVSNRLILRLSPDYITDYTIYAIELGGYKMAVSHNRGNSWQQRYVPGPVIDLAVEDKDTIYVALPGGYIRKNTNAGTAWISPPVSCFPDGAAEINMLTVVDKGHILVGSRDSRASYSADGGSSFIEITQAIGNSYRIIGDVQVVADANYSENGIIYAATNIDDDGIWRWVIGHSTEWEQIDESVTRLGMGQRISGLITGDEGTLYALRSEPVDGAGAGGMTRSLNPSQLPTTQVEFDIVNATLPVGATFDPLLIFPNTLPHLKLAGNAVQNELWSVDTANHIIYRFQDNLCKLGPFTIASGEIGCDPVSGRAQEVNLCWEQLSLADAYDIEVAKDKDFSIRIIDWVAEDAVTGFLIPASVTAPCAYFPAGGAAAGGSELAVAGNLECGHTYSWRVRVRHAATTEVIRSPWSEIRSFTVKTGLPVRAEYYGPRLLSPNNGCIGCPVEPASFSWSPFKETTKYRFVLAKDAAMTQVIAQATVATTAYEYKSTLDYSTNYFWRVMTLEPSPSDWSATFSFQTEPAPTPLPTSAEASTTPLWVWVVIGIGAILVIVTLVLIFKTS